MKRSLAIRLGAMFTGAPMTRRLPLIVLLALLALPSWAYATLAQPRIPVGSKPLLSETGQVLRAENGSPLLNEMAGPQRTPITVPRKPRL